MAEHDAHRLRLSFEGIVTALLATALVGLAFARHEPAVLSDDAYISFRYADNLAAGRGLVFNEGERVEGYSNLSWTLLLAAARVVGIPPVLSSQILGAMSGWLTMVLLPGLAVRLGGRPIAGVCAALALGLTATFSSWMLRGLEGPLFTLLLVLGSLSLCRDLFAERDAGALALTCFAIASVTRPEGPMFLLAVAAALLLSRGGPRAALRFLALTSLWVAQTVFRVLYYGDALPNSYRAKVWEGADRYRFGLDYLASFAKGCGVPLGIAILAGIGGALYRIHKAPQRVCLALALSSLFFSVASGGDGFVHWRFFQPFLPLALALAATAVTGVAGLVLAAALPLLVIASEQGQVARQTVSTVVVPAIAGDAGARTWLAERVRLLTEDQEIAPRRVGEWLRRNLPAGSLIAVNDCGMIPYESGLPTLDTIGLMDRHLALMPGRMHEKMDLRYVLSRRPEAVILHLRDLGTGLPLDRRMAIYPPFLQSYRLAHAEPFGVDAAYYVFRRAADPVLPPEGIDLVSLFRTAGREVSSASGSRDAGRMVRLSPRCVTLSADRLRRLDDLAPRSGESVGPERLAALDAAFHELGPESHDGIMVKLVPPWESASLRYDLSGSAGRTLHAGLLAAPWVQTRAGASLEAVVRTIARESRVQVMAGPLDLALPEEANGPVTWTLTVRRMGPAGSENDPLEVLIESPWIER